MVRQRIVSVVRPTVAGSSKQVRRRSRLSTGAWIVIVDKYDQLYYNKLEIFSFHIYIPYVFEIISQTFILFYVFFQFYIKILLFF